MSERRQLVPAKGSDVRKVVAYELLSLDGVAESPDSFIDEWDGGVDAHLAAVIAE